MNEYDYLDDEEFTPDQKQEIEEGILAGLNVSIYAKHEYMAIQMLQIRLGLMERLPVEYYASPEYDWFQMEEIRKGLKKKVDVKKYASPDIPFDVMRQIREGLENGIDLSVGKKFPAGVLRQLRLAACENIDISKYIKEGYQEEQLKEIRIAKEKGLNIDPYVNIWQRGAFIREIALGLEKELDVSLYADSRMNWQQMREIRKGLEARIDVTKYQNPLYSWQQMREIRKGMEKDLPVEEYSSFMYTAREMRKKRHELADRVKNAYKKENKATIPEKVEYKDFVLLTNSTMMEAYIMVSEIGTKISSDDLINALKERGIIAGIDYKAIDNISKNGADKDMITIARGSEPQTGRDGWYEYFFETDIKRTPKLLENGSVDYQNIKWFEIVNKGDKVAYYHIAEEGKAGIKVNGERIPGKKGKNLQPIKGFGFKLMPDNRTYIAGTNGKVDLKDGRLEISSVLVLDDVTTATGNVSFDGSVYVKGMACDGVEIKATKDILVDGFTEAAVLEAGGDIILRKGNNARGKGYLKAGRDIMGNFFENARLVAGRDMKANYCLNSEVYADHNIEISGEIGTLAGGSAYAGECIKSTYIGNQAGIATSLKAGKEEWYLSEKASVEERESDINRELTLLKNAYFDFQRKYKPEYRNNNPIYIKIENAIYTKELELKEIDKTKLKLNECADKLKLAKIVVAGKIYQSVKVNINGALWNSKETGNVTLKKKDGAVAIYRNI